MEKGHIKLNVCVQIIVQLKYEYPSGTTSTSQVLQRRGWNLDRNPKRAFVFRYCVMTAYHSSFGSEYSRGVCYPQTY